MKDMDLIPADIHFLMKWNLKRVGFYMLVISFLAVSMIWRIQLNELKTWEERVREREKEISFVESKKAEAAKLLARLEDISRSRRELIGTAELVREYSGNGMKWSDFMALLAEERFSELWLNRISVEEKMTKGGDEENFTALRVVLGGRCLRLSELSRLLGLLERNPRVENVVLYRNERGVVSGKELYTFLIKGEVPYER